MCGAGNSLKIEIELVENINFGNFSKHITTNLKFKYLIFQIQGNIFLDFFLFNPNSPSRCASELAVVKILLQSGKEKFIIHPVVETFMKMKWRKTWFLFWIYLFLFASFFFALTAFSLAHYGALTAYAVPSLNDSLQKGYQFDYGSERTCWW